MTKAENISMDSCYSYYNRKQFYILQFSINGKKYGVKLLEEYYENSIVFDMFAALTRKVDEIDAEAVRYYV